jgi:hypothetical protein
VTALLVHKQLSQLTQIKHHNLQLKDLSNEYTFRDVNQKKHKLDYLFEVRVMTQTQGKLAESIRDKEMNEQQQMD